MTQISDVCNLGRYIPRHCKVSTYNLHEDVYAPRTRSDVLKQTHRAYRSLAVTYVAAWDAGNMMSM